MSNQKTNPSLDQKQPELSKEELAARRKEITEFYTDNIPHLEKQAEYEMLLTTIEKARAERMQAQMFMSQTFADQSDKNGVSPESDEGKAFQEAMKNASKA